MNVSSFILTLMMLFVGLEANAQGVEQRRSRILESPDSINVYYLYGNNGWGNVPKGWRVQQTLLREATESDLEQTVLHSRTPAYRAMAYHALVAERSDRCYDLLLRKLSDSSTFTIASGDVWFDFNVASFMMDVTSDSESPMFTKEQQRHVDSLILFSDGLEHLDKYAPALRLKGVDGLYGRLRELHLSGTPNLLPIIAEYRNEDDIPMIIDALREYSVGLDNQGGLNPEGLEGDTNSALYAIIGWNDDAFIPALEELRDYELSRRYLDYNRVKMLFKVVMSYDNEWAYNFIDETFGKMRGAKKYSYPENLFSAYYEEEEIPRFRPLVEKYGEKPFDWDIMQEIENIGN